MQCPICLHHSFVVRTIKLNNPTHAIRYRVCQCCYYEFTTKETLDEPKADTPLPQPPKDRQSR